MRNCHPNSSSVAVVVSVGAAVVVVHRQEYINVGWISIKGTRLLILTLHRLHLRPPTRHHVSLVPFFLLTFFFNSYLRHFQTPPSLPPPPLSLFLSPTQICLSLIFPLLNSHPPSSHLLGFTSLSFSLSILLTLLPCYSFSLFPFFFFPR